MMLRPVKLNSAGNPRPRQTDQSRLDDMIVINEIIVIGLVISSLNTASQLRKDHDTQILILQPYRIPCMLCLFTADLLYGRIRVNLAGASLVYSLFKKQRIFVR